MADKADIAGDLIEQNLEAAMANHRNQVTPKNDEPYCLECGEEIPAARREALPGCAHCVSCQNDLELARRTRG